MPVFGERRNDQVCVVYESPLGFMAPMESVECNVKAPIILSTMVGNAYAGFMSI